MEVFLMKTIKNIIEILKEFFRIDTSIFIDEIKRYIDTNTDHKNKSMLPRK